MPLWRSNRHITPCQLKETQYFERLNSGIKIAQTNESSHEHQIQLGEPAPELSDSLLEYSLTGKINVN